MARVTSKTKFTLGPDIDLEKEVLRDGKGQRITQKVVDEIVEEIFGRPGRPPLSKRRVHAPQIRVRVPETLKAKVDKTAKKRGITPSELVREALEKYLKSA